MIKDSLKVGMAHSSTVEISRERTISFLGENLRIYATPHLVNDVEQTCLDFLLTHVDDGENSVGTLAQRRVVAEEKIVVILIR